MAIFSQFLFKNSSYLIILKSMLPIQIKFIDKKKISIKIKDTPAVYL